MARPALALAIVAAARLKCSGGALGEAKIPSHSSCRMWRVPARKLQQLNSTLSTENPRDALQQIALYLAPWSMKELTLKSARMRQHVDDCAARSRRANLPNYHMCGMLHKADGTVCKAPSSFQCSARRRGSPCAHAETFPS